MVITKTKFCYFLLTMCILLQNRFFHILNASMAMTFLMLLTITLLFVITISGTNYRCYKYSYNYMILLVVLVIVPQTIFAFTQGETVEGYIDVMRGIYNVLLIIPILYLFLRKGQMKSVLDMVTLLTCITLGLLLINCFFLNNFNTQLLPFDYFQRPENERGDWVRIYLISDFTGVVAIYAFCMMIKKEGRRFWYILAFVISLGASIYVEQSRMQYMAIMASCVLVYTRTLRKNKIWFYLAAGIFVIVGLFGDWFASFFESFSVNNDGLGISTKIRLYEIRYALDLIIKHPFMGTGMVANYLFDVVIDGFAFEFNHTDIGLLGTITYIGLIGTIALFIEPYCRLVNTMRKFDYHQKKTFDYSLLYGLIVFITITSLTTIITDNSRIFAWPFIIAIFEYSRYRLTTNFTEAINKSI